MNGSSWSESKFSEFSLILFAICVCVLSPDCFAAQTVEKPASTPSNRATSPSCSDRTKAAHADGYKEGVGDASASCDSKLAESKSQSFLAGFQAGESLGTKDLGSTDGKTPISIVVEDVPGADSYRFAAAEVITTYFLKHYVIVPKSELVLYISSSNNDSDHVISFQVQLMFYAGVPVKTAGKNTQVSGFFVVSTRGGFLLNYSQERKTQAIKEDIFSVLTEGDSSLYPSK